MIIKLLIVTFTLFVGGCFTVWPQKVNGQFEKWRGSSVGSFDDGGIRQNAAVFAIRQMGAFLIVLTCYLLYLWIKEG